MTRVRYHQAAEDELLHEIGYLYSIEKDGLLVLAVAHHHRRPGYWVHRTSENEKAEQDRT